MAPTLSYVTVGYLLLSSSGVWVGFRVWRFLAVLCLALFREQARHIQAGFTQACAKKLSTVWCLVGNGGLDPYSSPLLVPNNSLHNPQSPFPTKNQTEKGFWPPAHSASDKPLNLLQGLGGSRVPVFRGFPDMSTL